MKRLVRIITLLSMLLCIGLVGLAIAAHTGIVDAHWTWISPGGHLHAMSLRGVNRLGVGLTYCSIPQYSAAQPGWSASPVPITDIVNPPGKPYAFRGFPFFGGSRYRPILPPSSGVPQPNWSAIVIPYRYPIIAAAYIPFIYAVAAITRNLMRRRRGRMGLCIECGYDLRASSERCPECGTQIPHLSMPTANTQGPGH